MIEQKLDYIHNSVQGKWMLAYDPLSYKYSSARYYENGDKELIYYPIIWNTLSKL
jgi:hypothetical protein